MRTLDRKPPHPTSAGRLQGDQMTRDYEVEPPFPEEGPQTAAMALNRESRGAGFFRQQYPRYSYMLTIIGVAFAGEVMSFIGLTFSTGKNVDSSEVFTSFGLPVLVWIVIGKIMSDNRNLQRRRISARNIAALVAAVAALYLLWGTSTFLCFLVFLIMLVRHWWVRVGDKNARRRQKEIAANDAQSHLPTLDMVTCGIFGVAGGNVGANADFGKAGEMGVVGEKNVATVIDRIHYEFPWVQVIHGLKFDPEQRFDRHTDVDHAVLIGDTLALIDAKYWGYGTYAWQKMADPETGEEGTQHWQVWKDGAPFDGSRVHFQTAVGKWQLWLKTVDFRNVKSFIVAAMPDPNGKYAFENRYAGMMIPTLTDLKGLEAALREIIAANDRFVDRYALAEILRAKI